MKSPAVKGLPRGSAGDSQLALHTGLMPAKCNMSQDKGLIPPAKRAKLEEEGVQEEEGEKKGEYQSIGTVAIAKQLRKDQPRLKKRGQGSQQVALAIAASPARLSESRDELMGEMLAATTKENKKNKLRLAERVATTAGHVRLYPLTEEVILDVAACIEGASSSSGLALTPRPGW